MIIVIKFDLIIGRCRFTQDPKHRLSVGSPPGREFLEASPPGKLVLRRVRHTASVINGPGPGDTSGNSAFVPIVGCAGVCALWIVVFRLGIRIYDRSKKCGCGAIKNQPARPQASEDV